MKMGNNYVMMIFRGKNKCEGEIYIIEIEEKTIENTQALKRQ